MSAQEMRKLLNQLNESFSDQRLRAIEGLEALKSDLVDETEVGEADHSHIIDIFNQAINDLKSRNINEEWIENLHDELMLAVKDSEDEELVEMLGIEIDNLYKTFGINKYRYS